MSAKETTIPALLTASASWTALVTGGTWTWDTLGRLGLTPEVAATKGCYDTNGKLKLTAVLTFGTSSEAEILTSERAFMRLWLYHDSDYALIRQARRLAKDLLDRKQASSSDEGAPLIRWTDDMNDFVADELGGAMAGGSRYAVRFRRQ
jgi:hypothetical protein